MESSKDLLEIYGKYLTLNPKEAAHLVQYKNFISQTSDDKLYDRKNFIGHITASAIIINAVNSKILLIKHQSLGRWLQPGGHVDPTDESILSAALREANEEAGINTDELRLIAPSFFKNVPLDIDTHAIPTNEKKGEPKHFHHDFKYFFIYTCKTAITVNEADASAYNWESLENVERDNVFTRSIIKVRRLLGPEFRPKIFFDNIINSIPEQTSVYKAVIVSHLLPGAIYFHQALNQAFPIATIIPKPNSINKEILEETVKEFDITHITRNEIAVQGNELIRKLEKESGEFIFFDIGGYFVDIFDTWPANILDRIKLIVEDTENGHQKYEKKGLDMKVVSVARSPLKDNEDFLVGQSVLFSADALLRANNVLIQYQKNAVFGYGKIGKTITIHLLQRGVKPMVYDINPIKRIEAFNGLAEIPSRENIIKTADIIFSATGNKCLTIQDFRDLKNGTYVFSVTSSDDEMDLTFLAGEYQSGKKEGIHMTRYYSDTNYFYLVNDGNAVNFIHGAIMGNFIHLVRSEMMLAVLELANYQIDKTNVVSDDLKQKISDIWLRTFDPSGNDLSFALSTHKFNML